MPYDERTAERVRRALGARDVVEKRMMGGLCFMLDGHMCCAVMRSELMLRVGRDAYAKTLAEAHVRPLEFGGRRPIGYVVLAPAGFSTDASLRKWLRRAQDVVAGLPARTARGKKQ